MRPPDRKVPHDAAKIAEPTSGIGARVLGVGLGAMFPHWFGPSAGLIVFAGVVTHAFGMWDKHHLKAQAQVDTGRVRRGLAVAGTLDDPLGVVDVIVDCTPKRIAAKNVETY